MSAPCPMASPASKGGPASGFRPSPLAAGGTFVYTHRRMNYWLIASLYASALVLMVLELRGVPLTLQLPFKGDIKRESQWLAQFGQAVATAVAMALIFAFERHNDLLAGGPTPLEQKPGYLMKPLAVMAAVLSASFGVFAIKRLTGRVRPNRPDAGKFLGPSWKHANWRESFPSSHSACAIALAVSLSMLYPQATPVFWTLGLITAVLRYLMDAHWPSDVLAGIATGYLLGHMVTGAVMKIS